MPSIVVQSFERMDEATEVKFGDPIPVRLTLFSDTMAPIYATIALDSGYDQIQVEPKIVNVFVENGEGVLEFSIAIFGAVPAFVQVEAVADGGSRDGFNVFCK